MIHDAINRENERKRFFIAARALRSNPLNEENIIKLRTLFSHLFVSRSNKPSLLA
jgi:hypothetical protein